MEHYVIERGGDSWALRLFAPSVTIAGPMREEESLDAVRNYALRQLVGHAPCCIRVVTEVGEVREEWSLWPKHDAWSLRLYTFERDGRTYVYECPSPGISSGGTARAGNARWLITVEGTQLGAFSGEPDDGADLADLEDRVVAWWAANGPT